MNSQIVLSFVIVNLLLAACSTLTEKERAKLEYDRSNDLIEAREQYERQAEICRQNGGSMQIKRYSSSRTGHVSAREYRAAECMRQ